MLLDIRELGELPQANSFFDMAIHRLTSRSERIRICNQLRTVLSSRSKIRWCGAEYESLFDRNVVQNAPEINGLAELGRSMSIRGVWSGTYPQPKSGDHTSDVIAHCLTFTDPGMRKLCALFHSVAIPHSTIIYIGSAPGHAWLGALSYYKNISKVISIDPRPLEGEVPSNVVHHALAITSPGDLLMLMQAETNCILVWDVRGDAYSSAERDHMVLAEIALLNSILQETSILNKCFLLHIKINMKHCVSYYLPERGRFFVQPYTLMRDVYETRYVVHLRESVPLVFTSLTIAMRDLLIEEMNHVLASLRDGELTEAELVCNMLCSRYRRIDYLFERSYNDSVEEILFTINHNPSPKVLDHLKALRDVKRRYIVSFFTGCALGNDPYPFPEGEALLNELGTVLDSRSLVQAKAEGLYFLFSEQINDLFKEEAFTSETYRIRKTEYSVLSRSRIPVYDGVRNEACAAVGAVFPKFPNDFSIADALKSPSGHALRMVLEYISGKASLAMFAEKIICNFRSVSRSYVKRAFAQKQVKIGNSSFSNSLRHSGSERSSLERSTKGIWHSTREWLVGIDAAVRMSSPSAFQVEQIEAVKRFIMITLDCVIPGIEITLFYTNSFSTMSPLAIARRGRAGQALNEDAEDPVLLCDQIWHHLSTQSAGAVVPWLTRMDSRAATRD